MGKRSCDEYKAMISDLLTVIIVVLMAVLVIYPASRTIWLSWQSWLRRQAQRDDPVRRN